MTRALRTSLAAAAASALLATAIAPSRAHAQDAPPPRRPAFGVGVYGGGTWPDMLALRAPARAAGFPLAPSLGLSLRGRLGNRFMIVGALGGYLWGTGSQLGELDPTFRTEPVAYNVLALPLDLGLRVNVVPVPGPVAVYLGAGGRATLLNWAATYGSGQDVIASGMGFTAGVWPEVALEVTSMRRFAWEIFARYTIGLLPGETASEGLPFHRAGAVGGLLVGLAVHLYL